VQLVSEWEVSEEFRNKQQSVNEKWAVNRLHTGVRVIKRAEQSEQMSQTANTAWIRRWQRGWIAKVGKSYKRVYGPKQLWQWNIRKCFM